MPGSEVSLCRLLEDVDIQSLVSHDLLQTGVLPLELIETFGLLDTQPTVLATPPIEGLLGDAHLPTDQTDLLPSGHLDFDLELATEKSEANPVFYLQYAHARCHSLTGKAAEAGIESRSGDELKLLTDERELLLMKRLADYPWEIQSAGKSREPQRIISFLTELAGNFHTFYHDLRVISPEEPELSGARLTLCKSVGIIMANGLRLLGVSAPERM